jgi:enoyl-CoA hydratase/carnithine racemase
VYVDALTARGAGAFGDEIALTGRQFTAEEALAANCINRVAPKGQHMAVAHELAAAIATNPPLSVRATVRTRRWFLTELTREAHFQAQPMKLYLTEDFHEAALAFKEKRKPALSRAAKSGMIDDRMH